MVITTAPRAFPSAAADVIEAVSKAVKHIEGPVELHPVVILGGDHIIEVLVLHLVIEGIHPVEEDLHLPADGVIVHRAGEAHDVGLHHLRKQAVGIVLLEALPFLQAHKASLAVIQFLLAEIHGLHLVTALGGAFGKLQGQKVRVAVLAGTARYDKYLFHVAINIRKLIHIFRVNPLVCRRISSPL